MQEQVVVRATPITGPRPRRAEFLPFCLPDITEAEIAEVVDALRSGWLTTGPKTQRFEERFRAYVGSQHAIPLSSCTAGLHLALVAANIGAGDEVIVPTFTFCATANVVVHTGAKPILADVRPGDLNLDPDDVRRKITPRTRAIIPVHLAGHPCDMDALLDIAEQYGLLVIEDAAHAVGADYRGRKVGTIGNITVFSFYATKNLTTGEGGMITTDDAAIAERVRLLSLHGMSHDAWKRYSAEGSWYYEVLAAGYKYNMTDIQAALGLHQLARLEGFLEVRGRLAGLYTAAFSQMPEIIVPKVAKDVRHAWHLYFICLQPGTLQLNRNQFIEALRQANIGTSVHFIPLHRHPYYRERYGYSPIDFPVADAAYQSIISLPLYTRMTVEDINDVIEAVENIIVQYRR